MEWVKKYLNLPYKNHNCFEFVVKVLNEQFDFPIENLPSYETSLIGMNKQILESKKIFLEPEKTENPLNGDCVLMSGRKRLNHVGLYLEHKVSKYLLLCMKNFGFSMLHKIKDLNNYGLEIEGFYRWQK